MSDPVIDSVMVICDDPGAHYELVDRPTAAYAIEELTRLAGFDRAYVWLIGRDPLTGTPNEVRRQLAALTEPACGGQPERNER